MCLSRKVAFVKRIDCTYRSYRKVRTESWNLSSYFPVLEKVWKRWSLEKMIKSLEFFFFEIYKCFLSEFFLFFFFFQSYSTSSSCLQSTTKKALFLRFKVSIDHLFDNLESGERNYCFGKSSGKSPSSSSRDIFFYLFFFFNSPSCLQRWLV